MLDRVEKAARDHVAQPNLRLFLVGLERALIDQVATGEVLVQARPVAAHYYKTMAYRAVVNRVDALDPNRSTFGRRVVVFTKIISKRE